MSYTVTSAPLKSIKGWLISHESYPACFLGPAYTVFSAEDARGNRMLADTFDEVCERVANTA